MTRKIIAIILLVMMLFLLCGCDINNSLARKTSNVKAYIKIDEKTIVIDVGAYTSYANGSVVVHGVDGKIYKTHFMNVVLVKDAESR